MLNRPKILIVDDDREVGTFFRHFLKSQYDVTVVYSGAEAEKVISCDFFDAAFVDMELSDANGLTILKHINEKIPHCSVIIMTGYSTVGTVVQAIQQGAFNYIEKPFDDLNYLMKLVTDALGEGQNGLSIVQSVDEGFVIGTNPQMRNLVSLARKIADKKINVLIEGETGTGKEVLARFIHRHSSRAAFPFVAVNCGAFTETLLESELFGHEKGSFTGALSVRRGIFEMADNGTLFLDEICEASIATQVKLLRVLENEEIYRIGGEHSYKCDVRIIAATNTELAGAVQQGRFREDLFYRLNVIYFKLPPLRERKEDIPFLVNYVVKNKFKRYNTVLSKDAMELLKNYHWPGNIRELVNVLTQVLAVCAGNEISVHDLPAKITRFDCTFKDKKRGSVSGVLESVAENFLKEQNINNGVNLQEIFHEIKSVQADIVKRVINRVLNYTGGNQKRAAKLLHISPRQLQYYLNEK